MDGYSFLYSAVFVSQLKVLNAALPFLFSSVSLSVSVTFVRLNPNHQQRKVSLWSGKMLLPLSPGQGLCPDSTCAGMKQSEKEQSRSYSRSGKSGVLLFPA